MKRGSRPESNANGVRPSPSHEIRFNDLTECCHFLAYTAL
jgi:hypothetical protein